MSTPEHISAGGRRTRVRLEGDPSAAPVVLVHGLGRSLEDWSPQYAQLSEHYRVIGLDLPGSGFSERMPGPVTLPALAKGSFETLDALGENRAVHLVGNSLGGAVAQQMLALQPGRIASLTLVASAGFGSEVALLLRLLSAPVVGRLMTLHTTLSAARLTERTALADRKLVTRSRIDHALAIAREPDTGAVLHETGKALATLRGVRPEWRERLAAEVAQHPRPTLIVWGDKDRALPVHHLAAAKKVIAHARPELLTGVGHIPQLERPDEFAAILLDFLAGVEVPARVAASRGRRKRARTQPTSGAKRPATESA